MLAVALVGCKQKAVSTAPIEKYQMDGVVEGIDTQGHVAKIKAQEIKGWMEAMTMDYPMKNPADLATIHVGDHITATVYVQGLNYSIGEIHQVR